MLQATKSHTTNVVNFKRAPVAPALSAEQAQTLWELCALAAYHPSGFTHTRKMTAVTRFIADTAGPGAVAACLARADIRERAYVTRKR
jgi:hypothetical protein